jgi:agmatinase
MSQPTSTNSFDPNSPASLDSGLFGLPYSAADSLLHVIPVPWEVTTSYGDGTSRGPQAILDASRQVDLFDLETGNVYRNGYYMLPISEEVEEWNEELKGKARSVLELLDDGGDGGPQADRLRAEINRGSERLNDWVYAQAKDILAAGKFAALIGGDHSTPFGLIRALTEKHGAEFGILHIDAHADMREAYQGYEHSHASIMFNVMEKLKPRALVQVGIRDFSEGEFAYIEKNPRVFTFFDSVLKRRQHRGDSWQKICDDIVAKLPELVYLSFDIDGLSPDLCPHTGTPVPGGLSFHEVLTLFATVVENGKRIIGFDLNEVAAPEGVESSWDGNVGARLLFKMAGWLMVSNGQNPSRGRDA